MKRSILAVLITGILLGATLCMVGCTGSKAPESIGVTSNAQILSQPGESFDLASMLVFEENTDQTVEYVTSDANVADVSADGIVTATGNGTATIQITSAADKTVTTSVDVAVYDYYGIYAGEKYIDAMGCNIATEITLQEDGTFIYYRGPMNVNIEGGGQMPELSDQGTYAVTGTEITFLAETLGEYNLQLSIKDGAIQLEGGVPTGGPTTDMVLAQVE